MEIPWGRVLIFARKFHGKGEILHENLQKLQGSTDMRKGFLDRGGADNNWNSPIFSVILYIKDR